MVADQDAIERARAAADAARLEKDKKPRIELPPLVPGHKGSPHAYPVPPRTEEAAAKYGYVSYATLTNAGRERAARGEGQEFTLSADGGLVLKPASRTGDHSITFEDWILASRTAEELMRKYHPEDRLLALAAHHRLVQELNADHGWHVARAYDIRQREIAAADITHDLTGLDARCLTTVVMSFQAKATSTFLSAGTAVKRGATRDAPTQPASKRPRTDSRCFRCGATGHLPSTCRADVTCAGRPVLSLDARSRSPNALVTADGKAVCFSRLLGHADVLQAWVRLPQRAPLQPLRRRRTRSCCMQPSLILARLSRPWTRTASSKTFAN
ncbi:hypothetical protein C8Q76DRAFT_670759 [Earliella scabrosa]|nr:hypothetical protein C8Q76DRAFT_670759 [Earliella scabrosa]